VIVLDTNVISEIFRSRPDARVVEWLGALNGDVAVTAVTIAELLAGVQRLPDGRRKWDLRAGVDATLRPYRETRSVLSFDEAAAEAFAEILTARESAGPPISMADAQIASICRVHGAVCATRNTKDFAGTGVELLNPWIE
jgi:predicted nucleic acid-binding protein